MADNLLNRLSDPHLPARRWESEQEVSEPSEHFEDRSQRGRSVDEVFESHQPREVPTETSIEETSTPAPREKTRTFVIEGREVTITEQQHNELLKRGIQTVAQQVAAAAQQQQQTQFPPVITNKAIDTVYRPVAQVIAQDLIATDLLEPDLFEVYEKSILTMIGQMRWLADRSIDQEIKQNQVISALNAALPRLEAVISWLNEHRAEIEGPQPEKRRGRDQQFLPSTKGGVALLNKMVARSGRIKGA
jgi:hypothetical protein